MKSNSPKRVSNNTFECSICGSIVTIQPLLLLLVSLLVATILLKKNSKASKKAPLPPGPTPWPIIGNLPEIWRNKPSFRWILGQLKEFKTEIACICLANTHVIPVISPEIAQEFLKKYDSIFASRPKTMASECSSRGYLSLTVVPQGDQWKKMKKVVASKILNATRFRWLLDKRNEEADNLVRFIYNKCYISSGSAIINLRSITRHYSGNIIRKMMFNKRYVGKVKEDGGPGLAEEEFIESLFIVLMHHFTFALSDYVPFLRILDLEGHEKIIREALRTINKYLDPLVDERVQQWRQGKKNKVEDWLDACILAKDANGGLALTVEEIKALCTDLLIAATDNTSNAVEWAMAEMINQPELLQKAIEEINSVVGKNRLVQEYDIPQLNYVKACAKEAFRLHPVAPFNVPHVAISDAIVAGYFIPKGSHILLSRLGLGRNPRVWNEPLKFNPMRHMKDGIGDVEITEPSLTMISFSIGRRGCMGVALGSAMTGMLLARLIQGFTWTIPPTMDSIDLSESKDDLFMAKPLHAQAKPRLPSMLYPV